MSIVSTSPACALPGRIHSPGLAAWKVTVTAARTARPRPRRSRRRRRSARPRSTTGAPRGVDRVDRLAPPRRAARPRSRCRAARRRSPPALERTRDRAAAARARSASPRPAVSRRGASPGRRSRFARASPENSCRRRHAHHRHLPAGLAQQPRDDQPVAAVVALAAHDRHRPVGREPLDRPRDAGAGALHQLEPRHAPLARSPSGRSPRIVAASGSGVSQSRQRLHEQRC